MGKKLQGVWHENIVLCPKCLVKPDKIKDYGADEVGFWFAANCPHCRSEIRWHRGPNFTKSLQVPAQGEQLTLEVMTGTGKKRSDSHLLVFRQE